MSGPVPALVAEAARKSRVCWLSWSSGAERLGPLLAWHAWYDDAMIVLSHDDEQVFLGLADAGTAEVTMRSKDTGARLVTWTGTVEVVDPADASWEPCAAALLAVRLNLPEPAAAKESWRRDGVVLRVTPRGGPAAATGEGGSGPLP